MTLNLNWISDRGVCICKMKDERVEMETVNSEAKTFFASKGVYEVEVKSTVKSTESERGLFRWCTFGDAESCRTEGNALNGTRCGGGLQCRRKSGDGEKVQW